MHTCFSFDDSMSFIRSLFVVSVSCLKRKQWMCYQSPCIQLSRAAFFFSSSIGQAFPQLFFVSLVPKIKTLRSLLCDTCLEDIYSLLASIKEKGEEGEGYSAFGVYLDTITCRSSTLIFDMDPSSHCRSNCSFAWPMDAGGCRA